MILSPWPSRSELVMLDTLSVLVEKEVLHKFAVHVDVPITVPVHRIQDLPNLVRELSVALEQVQQLVRAELAVGVHVVELEILKFILEVLFRSFALLTSNSLELAEVQGAIAILIQSD